MKHQFNKYLVGLLLFLVSISSFSSDFVEIPSLKSRVTDLTNTLSAYQKTDLENQLAAFEKQKGSQVIVLIVPSTQPEEIEQFTIRVAEKWKIGRKGIDDGVILIIAKEDRKLRIEVGYGLEGAIPDIYAKRIIENVIVPNFRSGDFERGVREGVNAIISLIEGEELPAVTESSNNNNTNNKNPSVFLLMIGWFVLSFIRSIVKNKILKFVLAIVFAILVFLLVKAIFMSIVYFIISLIILFSTGGRGGAGGGFYGGGFGGSSGGSSFGGGGFSGGGGSFGGGGSSGGW